MAKRIPTFKPMLATAVVIVAGLGLYRAHADAVDHKAAPIAGDYLIYSGTMDDTRLPNKKDAKVSLHFTGKLASDLYRYLGPSVQKDDACVSGDITRSRGDLQCVLRADKSPTECWIGINVMTGRSVAGVIC